MKKLVFLTPLALVLLVVFFLTANIALAEQQIAIKGDSMLVYEVKVIKTKTLIAKYPKQPIQVPVDTALAIMRSGQGQYVEKIKPQIKYSFSIWPLSIPVIKSSQSFSQRTWEYASGKWVPPTPFTISMSPLEFDLISSIFALYVVLLCVLIVSLINRFLKKIEKRNQKLLIFYASILGVSVLAALLGLINEYIGIIIGVVVGVVVGGFTGSYAGLFAGLLVGLFTGAYTGAYAGLFAGENLETAINYLVFLFFACLVSYLLAILASKIKTRYFTKKLTAQPAVVEK